MEPNPPGNLRLFTAVALPVQVKQQLNAIVDRLKKGTQFTGAHPTWVAPENLHITLVFLGSTPTEKIEIIRQDVNRACEPASSFSLHFSGIELFPSPRDPRVIAIGIHGDFEKLLGVHGHLASNLRSSGFAVEDRPYRPHLTLARIKSARGLAGLRDIIKSHANQKTDKFPVSSITLFQSILSPQGARYSVLHECSFGDPNV